MRPHLAVLRQPRLMSTMAKSSALIIPFQPNAAAVAVANVEPGKLWSSIPGDPQTKIKPGEASIFYNTPTDTKITAVASLGDNFASKSTNVKRELVRKAVGAAVQQIKAFDGIDRCEIDATPDPHAAAVAAYLSRYKFTLKTSPPSRYNPSFSTPPPEPLSLYPLCQTEEWDTGVKYAEAQNFAKTLMELPANMCTPTKFVQFIRTAFSGLPNCQITVHEEVWARAKGMNAFLSVTNGTAEPAKFLEIKYNGGPEGSRPLAFVGKGITFDSGGISLKPSADMKLMRGDMGGAAVVCSAALAIVQLQLPINLVVAVPLCENLPGGRATKPGDIIYAMNGKSIEVDNTDAEGRLILSDALHYVSKEYKPHTLIDVATLTGAILIGLGSVFSGVFSTSDSLWNELHTAGEIEYDRFWRMPLDEEYGPQIYSSNADLCNTGGKPAGSCTAALFLKAFVEGIEPKDGNEATVRWAHIDIAGVMEAERPGPYHEKGMTGRPVRALVEFTRRLSKTNRE